MLTRVSQLFRKLWPIHVLVVTLGKAQDQRLSFSPLEIPLQITSYLKITEVLLNQLTDFQIR